MLDKQGCTWGCLVDGTDRHDDQISLSGDSVRRCNFCQREVREGLLLCPFCGQRISSRQWATEEMVPFQVRCRDESGHYGPVRSADTLVQSPLHSPHEGHPHSPDSRADGPARLHPGDACARLVEHSAVDDRVWSPSIVSVDMDSTLLVSAAPTTRQIVARRRLAGHRQSRYNSDGLSGRGAVWLARLHGVQEVGGSSPLAPILHSSRIEQESDLRLAYDPGPFEGVSCAIRDLPICSCRGRLTVKDKIRTGTDRKANAYRVNGGSHLHLGSGPTCLWSYS